MYVYIYISSLTSSFASLPYSASPLILYIYTPPSPSFASAFLSSFISLSSFAPAFLPAFMPFPSL